MARTQYNPDESSIIQKPSQAEKEKFDRLFKRITPSAAAHEEYLFQVEASLNAIVPALRRAPQGVLRSLRLRRSELFNGRQYLVACVEDRWLGRIAPECDAIASASTAWWEDGFRLPPLVFLPESKRRARNVVFRSVVEHEFVHVNQALMGTFPSLPSGRRSIDLFDLFLSRTAAEYEAAFLQFVQWPDTVPAQAADLTLDHWCLLRAYSQTLEHILLAAVELDFPDLEVETFLHDLPVSLPDALRNIGAPGELAHWFPPLLTDHLLTAMRHVIAFRPAVKEHPAFRTVGLWLRARLDQTKLSSEGGR